MIDTSVIHDTFAIERSYPAIPSRVFAAFASAEARKIWGDVGDVGEPHGEAGAYEPDFRVGGRSCFRFKYHDMIYRYDVQFYDIVPDQRIVYAYEVFANDVPIKVSVVTIEFAKRGDGTALVWTEQAAYLDNINGPALRAGQRGGEVMDRVKNSGSVW